MNRIFFLDTHLGVPRFVTNFLWLCNTLPWIPGNKGLELTVALHEWPGIDESVHTLVKSSKEGVLGVLNQGVSMEVKRRPWRRDKQALCDNASDYNRPGFALENFEGVSGPPVLWPTLTEAAERQGARTESQASMVAELHQTSEIERGLTSNFPCILGQVSLYLNASTSGIVYKTMIVKPPSRVVVRIEKMIENQ